MKKLFALFAFVLCALACETADDSALRFSGANAYRHVKAQTELGPRNYGSEGYYALRKYIVKELTALGLKPNVHTFVSEAFPERNGENYYAVIPAKGKTKRSEYIVLAGHYDTRSVAEKDPDPLKRNEPIEGANDGGSSVAALLELARALLSHSERPYPVMLIFFDLEDDGSYAGADPLTTDWIQGSIAFANEEILARSNAHLGILLDMVGYARSRYGYETYAYALHRKAYEAVWDEAERLGYAQTFIRRPIGAIIDDHLPFVLKGIPFIDVIGMDYPYHHTHADVIHAIDPGMLEKVGRVVESIALKGISE